MYTYAIHVNWNRTYIVNYKRNNCSRIIVFFKIWNVFRNNFIKKKHKTIILEKLLINNNKWTSKIYYYKLSRFWVYRWRIQRTKIFVWFYNKCDCNILHGFISIKKSIFRFRNMLVFSNTHKLLGKKTLNKGKL